MNTTHKVIFGNSMSIKLKVFLFSFFSCFFASLMVFIISLARQEGYGRGDMGAFIIWTIMYSLLMGGIVVLLFLILSKLSKFIQYIFLVIIGLCLGFIWTFIVALLLGPWFGAFSIPVLACWTAGSLSSTIFIAGFSESVTYRFHISKIVFVILVSITLSIGFKPLMAIIINDQKLTLVVLKWTPSDSLKINNPFSDSMNEEEKNLIMSSGIKGNIDAKLKTTTGDGREARFFIIIQSPVKSLVKLHQPDRMSVVYIQDGDKFKMYPQDAKTLDRVLEIYPFDSNVVNYWLELPGGGRQGGTFMDWK